MKIEEDQEEMIVNFGALNYDAFRMSIVFGIDEIDIQNEMKNEKSKFFKLYKKGEYISSYLIDLKLFELAKTGDLKAIKEYERRKKIIN